MSQKESLIAKQNVNITVNREPSDRKCFSERKISFMKLKVIALYIKDVGI